jgi:hypothetical protein
MKKTVSFDLAVAVPQASRSVSVLVSTKGILKKHIALKEQAQIRSRIRDSEEKIAAFMKSSSSFSKLFAQFASILSMQQAVSYEQTLPTWEVKLHYSAESGECTEAETTHLSVNSQGSHLIVTNCVHEVLDTIPLGNISGFIIGPKTPDFEHYNWITGSPWLCFSIIHWTFVEDSLDINSAFAHHSLDIECKSWREMQSIFWGIHQLSAKADVFTAKRFRDEVNQIKKLRNSGLFR